MNILKQVMLGLQLVSMSGLGLLVSAADGDVVGWRGDGTGKFQGQPPQTWSKTSQILWKTEMPGRGYSTPVFHRGRLYLTAEPTHVLAVNATTGEVLWRQKADYATVFGEEKAAEIRATQQQLEEVKRKLQKEWEEKRKSEPNAPATEELKTRLTEAEKKRNEYEYQFPDEKRGGAGNAAGTPICDGKRLFVGFGTGIVAALDLEGKLLWIKHLEGPKENFGHSSSPILADGKVIVHYQSMIALDANDGKEVWRQSINAKFGTPIAATIDGAAVLISPAGAIVRAADGRILAERQFEFSNNSPVIHEGIVYAHGGGKVKALRLPTSLSAPLTLDKVWEVSSTRDQRMASAVCHEGLTYAVTRNGFLEVNDLKDGSNVYRRRLEIGEVFASPMLAGNKVYICGNDGKTLVLKAGRDYEELAVNELEKILSSPICVGSNLFVRTDKFLICLGNRK